MPNPFEYIRNKVQQHNVVQLAKICNQTYLSMLSARNFDDLLHKVLINPHIAILVLQVSKKFSDMPALVIQWNNGGFNDVPASPNNRNGVAGQNRNAIINFLTANGAINYHDTVFLFRDGPALATCEHNLPQWVRHQAAIPDICTAAIRINSITVGGGSRIEFEPFDQAFNR
ncbi:14541_t:CDS:2 [Funneliformis mosseae]|uniref:14541_t:CDS:1 n=1 Tax=Funneliformis mosseae TaxID=27381 RepID=A0A9N9CWX4_FUNMO|nr:14541_t:CDS:2 [Funneliformis mosseae]